MLYEGKYLSNPFPPLVHTGLGPTLSYQGPNYSHCPNPFPTNQSFTLPLGHFYNRVWLHLSQSRYSALQVTCMLKSTSRDRLTFPTVSPPLLPEIPPELCRHIHVFVHLFAHLCTFCFPLQDLPPPYLLNYSPVLMAQLTCHSVVVFPL